MVATPPVLELTDIAHGYGNQSILSNLSLSIKTGQIVCLLGASGSGKTTLLKLITGNEKQNYGTVAINGKIISDTKTGLHVPPEQRSIGLIFQDFALFPHLTVAENVEFGLKNKHIDRLTKNQRVDSLLKRVQLNQCQHKYPYQLSGGEQQRAALARALAPRPDIMLMDEPFSALDAQLRGHIRDNMLAILKEENTAVLMVTHAPDEAMRTGDIIALLKDGQIIQQGTAYHIYNNPVNKAAVAFLSDINVIKGIVSGALTDTPFGQFLTPGYADGAKVDIVIRPQHMRIDFDRAGRGPNPTNEDGIPARGIVQQARFTGKESIVCFAIDDHNLMLYASVPNVFLPRPGTVFWLSMRRERCFVFPSRNQVDNQRQR